MSRNAEGVLYYAYLAAKGELVFREKLNAPRRKEKLKKKYENLKPLYWFLDVDGVGLQVIEIALSYTLQ